MSKESSNKNMDKKYKYHPAGKDDTPKIVSAVFAIDDRTQKMEREDGKGKTKTVIVGSKERILSTELDEGMIIPASNVREDKKDITDREI